MPNLHSGKSRYKFRFAAGVDMLKVPSSEKRLAGHCGSASQVSGQEQPGGNSGFRSWDWVCRDDAESRTDWPNMSRRDSFELFIKALRVNLRALRECCLDARAANAVHPQLPLLGTSRYLKPATGVRCTHPLPQA